LDSLNMSDVIGAKPGDHTFMFDWIKDIIPQTHVETDEDGTRHEYTWHTDVPLNDTNFDYRVTVLQYVETKPSGNPLRFSWVTKWPLSDENVRQVMRAGRTRWRIENETFNTLKNQGYNFEPNYGHGNKNLCSVLTMLMMLAFLIDQ